MNHTTTAAATPFALSRPIRIALGAVLFAIATAVSAKVQVNLPNTPVPFTFQPMLVLLAGGLLGARLGAASQVLYLTLGVIGIPVFAFGGGAAYLLGHTGGYLLAYPLAAAAAGAIAGPRLARAGLAMLAGLAIIYAGGVAWLAVLFGAEAVLALGLLPFLLADLVKAAVAAIVVSRAREGSLKLFGLR